MPNFQFGMGLQSNPMDAYNEMNGMVKESRLAKLMGQGYTAPQEQRAGLLGQMAQIDPQAAAGMDNRFSSMDKRAAEQMQERARLVHAAWKSGNKAMAESLYGQTVALAKQVYPGFEAGPLDDATAEMFGQFAGGTQAAGVQSTYVDDQGRRVAIMRDGSVQVLGNNAPQNQIIDTGNGFYGVNKGNLQAAPVQVGGPPRAPSAPPQGGQFVIDPNLPPEVQASIRANEGQWANATEEAPIEIGGGGQLRSVPKPPPAITTYQQEQLSMARERMRIAEEARNAALEAKNAAAAVKDENAQRAASTRQAEAASTAGQLVGAIDRLTQSPGFRELGTAQGDLKISVPMLRNDVKDADAQLKNIAGQAALSTMARLKALSATGATGFGSLTAPELKLLENSMATLERDKISNAELQASLKIIRDAMDKVAKWNPQQSQNAAPANGNAGQQSGKKTLRYNPATGKIE